MLYLKSGLIIINKEHSKETITWAFAKGIEIIDKIDKKYPNTNIPDYSILLPDIFQVRPPLLLNALHKSLQNLSVDLFDNSKISHIEINKNKFEYLKLDNNKKLFAHNLIITVGAWSRLLLNSINSEVDIKPIRGQIICMHSKKILIDKLNLMPENTPHSVAAGIIYFIAQKCNININKQQINNISKQLFLRKGGDPISNIDNGL